MAWQNTSPQFVNREEPMKASLAPSAPADQGLASVAQFIRTMKDQRVKDLLTKNTLDKAKLEAELAPFEKQKLQAQATKAMQEATEAKTRADGLNSFLEGQKKTEAPTEIKEVAQNEIAIPNAPKVQSHAVEQNIDSDPAYQAKVRSANYALHMDKSMNPHEHSDALDKARKSSGKVHVTSAFADVIEASQPQNYEEAAKLLRAIPGANKYLERGDQDELLKSFPKQSDLDKADRDDKRFAAQQEHNKKMEGLSESANTMAGRKEIQAQTRDMGDKIADNQYNRVTSAINRINQDLDNGKVRINETTMTALKGLMARTDNITLTTAIINKVLGVNPVDDATKQALQDFENDPKAQKLMKDGKFTGFYANLADLVAASLKKESGAAVTPSELQTFLAKLGLSSWGGSAETFLAGLEKYSSDLDGELKGFNAKYDPEAISAFEARGGKIPSVIFRKGKGKDTSGSEEATDLFGPRVESSVAPVAPKKRLKFNPATGELE